ncbi:MAG: hypothetical protein ACM3OO_05940 [Planctomycetaceae bacterium]
MHRRDGAIHVGDAAERRPIAPASRRRLVVVLLAVGAAALTAGLAIRRGGRSIVERARGRADAMLDDAQLVSGRISEATQVVGETAASIVEGPDPARVVDPTAPPEPRSVTRR